jgi:uncharacterized membrane protein (UPF0127 family)
MIRKAYPIILVCLAALSACSPRSAEGASASAPVTAAARHAESGLPVIPLTVTTRGGKHPFRVEVASSGAEQSKGLMFRSAMGGDEGMIFPMDPPRDAAFWMRNTVISLDIIFVGLDGRILNIAANAVPYSETPLPSAGPVKAVLELIGGRAAALGIVPGDKVEW